MAKQSFDHSEFIAGTLNRYKEVGWDEQVTLGQGPRSLWLMQAKHIKHSDGRRSFDLQIQKCVKAKMQPLSARRRFPLNLASRLSELCLIICNASKPWETLTSAQVISQFRLLGANAPGVETNRQRGSTVSCLNPEPSAFRIARVGALHKGSRGKLGVRRVDVRRIGLHEITDIVMEPPTATWTLSN
ncbi:MAG: hypothetical protein QOH88_3158 [Verrucomicrobiota bacterium]|jgi:hypothetical protein